MRQSKRKGESVYYIELLLTLVPCPSLVVPLLLLLPPHIFRVSSLLPPRFRRRRRRPHSQGSLPLLLLLLLSISYKHVSRHTTTTTRNELVLFARRGCCRHPNNCNLLLVAECNTRDFAAIMFSSQPLYTHTHNLRNSECCHYEAEICEN